MLAVAKEFATGPRRRNGISAARDRVRAFPSRRVSPASAGPHRAVRPAAWRARYARILCRAPHTDVSHQRLTALGERS
jgi:hypothetical protein